MDALDEHDDLIDGEDVPAYRGRATAKLDQIAQQVRQALTEQSIDTPLFFIVPNSATRS